jgi:thioredoxin
MNAHLSMKSLHVIAAAALLLALPSCDRARKLLGKASKIPLPTPAATPPAATPSTGTADVRALAATEFDSFVATPNRLVVVDFHADWCGPCRTLGPVLEQVAAEFPGKVRIGKINVDHAGDLPAIEGVSGIPDVRLYRDGKLVDKFVGAIDAGRIRGLFEKHSAGITVDTAAAAPAEAAAPAAPPIQPMTKDWRPPGIERR